MVVETLCARAPHRLQRERSQLEASRPSEILRAVFPGGTITGCPKVRCMEIIAELEAMGRGAYTGSSGYLNRDGSCDFNILIRTITAHGQAGSVSRRRRHRRGLESRAGARGDPRQGRRAAARVAPWSGWHEHLDQRPKGHGDRLPRPRSAVRRWAVRDHARTGRRIRLLDLHLERLAEGCRRLGIDVPGAVRSSARRARARRCIDGVLKLIITRGRGVRGYRPTGKERCTRVLSLHALPPAEGLAKPVRVRLCRIRLGLNPDLAGMKTLNRLESVMARAEWRDERIWRV